MEKAPEPAYKRNPNTLSTNFDFGIPAGTVDSSTGKGNVMVSDMAAASEQMLGGGTGTGRSGRDCLAKLYELVRFPGSRKLVRRLLLAKFGYVDSGPRPAGLEPGYSWSTVADSELAEIFG
eukprot:SAG22_NODE_940_length_6402_cov_34.673172_7_plen_121_part_00